MYATATTKTKMSWQNAAVKSAVDQSLIISVCQLLSQTGLQHFGVKIKVKITLPLT